MVEFFIRVVVQSLTISSGILEYGDIIAKEAWKAHANIMDVVYVQKCNGNCHCNSSILVMRHNLIDTKTALIIMNTSFNLPLVIWLMMGFFEQLPKELEESAMLDGCGFTKRFFKIIFPLTKPGMIASAILAFVGAWNEFLFACILSVNKSKTLPVVIAGFITDRGLEWGPMAATAVITLVPVLILVWALQKHFVQGLAMGAVKG